VTTSDDARRSIKNSPRQKIGGLRPWFARIGLCCARGRPGRTGVAKVVEELQVAVSVRTCHAVSSVRSNGGLLDEAADSQPDHPIPLAMPKSYSTGSGVRIPIEPRTVGYHIRKRRLGLKQRLRDLATQLGLSLAGLRNWEQNVTKPEVRYIPAIIVFLGYDPLPVGGLGSTAGAAPNGHRHDAEEVRSRDWR